MKPSRTLHSGGSSEVGKYGRYIGEWGNFGGQPQKGIVTYGLSANRQRPFAGAMYAAVFNTYRRVNNKFWKIMPPVVIGYLVLDWAERKNKYLNSKAGRAETAAKEAAASKK